MIIILYILKYHLISVYFFIKLFHKQKEQVCFLSRQTNELSLNYKMIMKKLDEEHIPYNSVIKKVDSDINDVLRTQNNISNNKSFFKTILNNLKGAFSYYLNLYSQMRLIASSKVVLIDGYNLPVCILKHKRGTKIIQTWHALGAIKQFGYQVISNKDGIPEKVAKVLKMHRNYDYVLSSSRGMSAFFAEAFDVDRSKILEIGTPTIDYLRQKNHQVEDKIYNRFPMLKKKINVLYSPTFRVDKKNGLDELIKHFDFDKFNLIASLHPKDDNPINDKRVIVIKSKEITTQDLIKISDYVITDYSSLIIDTLVADKKLLLFVYDYDNYSKDNGLNIDLLKEYPHITKVRSKDINDILKEGNYNNKDYKKLYNAYYPKVKNSTKEIVKLIKECL